MKTNTLLSEYFYKAWSRFHVLLKKTRSQWQFRCLRSEPKSRLRENQNRDKQLFLKIVLSRTISCNPSPQQEQRV